MILNDSISCEYTNVWFSSVTTCMQLLLCRLWSVIQTPQSHLPQTSYPPQPQRCPQALQLPGTTGQELLRADDGAGTLLQAGGPAAQAYLAAVVCHRAGSSCLFNTLQETAVPVAQQLSGGYMFKVCGRVVVVGRFTAMHQQHSPYTHNKLQECPDSDLLMCFDDAFLSSSTLELPCIRSPSMCTATQAAGELEGWELPKGISLPVLMCRGEDGDLSEASLQAAAARVADSRTVTFARAGNCMHIDASELFLTRVDEFMLQVEAKLINA